MISVRALLPISDTAMTAARRLIPSSSGHGFGPVSGRDRVGNEATVSTWLVAGVQNPPSKCLKSWGGRLTKQSVILVTRSHFAVRCGGAMKTLDRNHLVASCPTRRSNGRALQEALPNKPCHATRNRFAIAHQTQSLARVRA